MKELNKTHYILDLWGCTKDVQTNKDVGLTFLRTAAKEAGAGWLFDHVHHFGEGSGYTAVIGLKESHISIHTWPEEDFVAIDVFMCGESKIEKSIEYILKSFNPVRKEINSHWRGETKDELEIRRKNVKQGKTEAGV